MDSKDLFLNALHSTTPSHEHDDRDLLYDFAIGSWDALAIDYTPEGTLSTEGEVHFQWVLDGRAIQDIWIVPKRSLRKESDSKIGNRYGTSLRMFDQKENCWKIYWMNPVTGFFCVLMGGREGENVIQTGTDNAGNLIKWSFKKIHPKSFHWVGEISKDQGISWSVTNEFLVTRKTYVL